MSFSNLEYLYNHLPGRYRRDDKDLFLKRYLQHFGTKLDGWDGTFDAFSTKIDPATATADWIAFWLDVLFGWSWFPSWFTLADKRRLYGNFAGHLARRGTRVGIEKFLADFHIVARVHTRTAPWGEFVWGERTFAFPNPLHLIVEIVFLQPVLADLCFWNEAVWGESFWVEQPGMFTDAQILDLVRYEQPDAQEITVVWRLIDEFPSDLIVWEQISW